MDVVNPGRCQGSLTPKVLWCSCYDGFPWQRVRYMYRSSLMAIKINYVYVTCWVNYPILPWIQGALSEFRWSSTEYVQKTATAINRPKEPWNSSLPPLDDVVVGGGIMETFAFLATNPPESSVFPRRGRRGSWRDPSYHQRNDRGLVKADAKQQIQRVQEVENM